MSEDNTIKIRMHEMVGKEFNFHGIADNCFRLDDVMYEAVEDPDDGYRSMMECVRIVPAASRPFFIAPIARVRISESPPNKESSYDQVDQTWDLVDVSDGHVWLTLGTKNTDDYYPWFAFEYFPKET